MRTPQSILELRRFLDMVNQFGKFSPVMAELTKPLSELLSKKSTWLWGPSQDEAFRKIKSEVASTLVLTWYDPSADTRIAADASSYGLGAVLLQKQRGEWKPASYMPPDQTDQESLVPLLNTKHLDKLPPHVLRFHFCLARFNYTVEHGLGKLLFTTDTLSRAPLESSQADHSQAEAIGAHVSVIMSQLPADKDRLEAYSKTQADDPVCSHLIHVCHNGWPERHKVKGELLRYWPARTDLSVCEGLLLYGTRIVVPKELQHQTLCKIHHGHQGIERCQIRVTTSVWWPGAPSQMETFVRRCSTSA